MEGGKADWIAEAAEAQARREGEDKRARGLLKKDNDRWAIIGVIALVFVGVIVIFNPWVAMLIGGCVIVVLPGLLIMWIITFILNNITKL